MTTSHETIDKARLHDRIKAAMLGYAIGDALGKGTEFMTVEEAHHYYPDGLKHYNQIIRDAHRSTWRKNEWTNDTDLVLITLDAIAKDKRFVERTHAADMKEWFDRVQEDAVPLMRWVLSNKEYVDDPKGVSAQVWRNMTPLEASNEALGRCLVLSLIPSGYREVVPDGCKLTHHDSRCISTAMVIARIAHSLLWHDSMPTREELEQVARDTDLRTLPYIDIAYDKHISDFDLDNPERLWYTRLAMGSALWALLNCNTMEEAIDAVVMEAGDADTNASLALALIGLKHGTDSLPQVLAEDLNDKQRVIDSAERFADAIIEMAEEGIE